MKDFLSHFRTIALFGTITSLEAGTLTVEDTRRLGNPDILGYNMSHFVPGTNAHDFWRYSGVNGARMFLSPNTIEPQDDIPGVGDGVTDQASFLARRAALRADPLNTDFIDWPDFEDRYRNNLTGTSRGGNRFFPYFAISELRALDIQMLIQITASESRLPISGDDDWAGKWELWQHFYAQAFFLGREFDVERYQMFNEPNHPNADGLTIPNWLMRLQLASDAIQTALADVNEMYGKSLTPLVYGPVNSGGDEYDDWGETGVLNRHTNFLGETDDDYLVMHRYDYHQYNGSPSDFSGALNSMRSSMTNDMAPERRFPLSISEFNVHTNGTFDDLQETIDTPDLYVRFGAISSRLARNFEDELYCFKFGQTLNSDDDANFPITKNGMHYSNSDGAPFTHGGVTRSAEVWRLFNKALKAGGDQLNFSADDSLDEIEFSVTFVPEVNNYYIFSANDGSGEQLTVDVSAWNLPAGTPFLLEEVSEDYYGAGRRWGTIGEDGILIFNPDRPDDIDISQNADTVYLITIPASGTLEEEEFIDASFDATVTDGSNASTSFSTTGTLLARNDPNSRDNRSAALMQFKLPLVYPPDIQLAVLTVEGRTNTDDATVQGHLYGLDDDSWAEEQDVTWNTAPNLAQGVSAGNLIANRFITEQGDSAHIQGQVVFTRDDYRERMYNVTEFLQAQSDFTASFMISQDPRWDIDIPSLDSGDTQVDGIDILSSEGGSNSSPGPRLRLVRLLDSDDDGISDQAEVETFGSNPNVADADGDNLNDGEELLLHQTNPALADSDSDGSDDSDEVVAGTDPNDSASKFEISSIQVLSDGSVELRWSSVGERVYRVYRSETLEEDSWGEPIGIENGDGNVQSFIDNDLDSRASFFYRLEVEHPE